MPEEFPIPTIADRKEVAVALPSTNFHQKFGELLQSGTRANIMFLVSGESFPAHKLILPVRSPVFMAEFFGEMKKSSGHVEVQDMDMAVFKAILHSIYTDTVPELDQRLEEVVTMAQHLLVAADRYGLDRLKLICESKLSGGISIDTAATTLALVDQHNCSQLKAKCAEFIVSTAAVLDAVLATEGYKHLACLW
jgi:speckle-type POZ protein